jgi:hypothetical protein
LTETPVGIQADLKGQTPSEVALGNVSMLEYNKVEREAISILY